MAITNYVWDVVNDNVTVEIDDNLQLKSSYHYKPTVFGSMLSQKRNSQTNYYHADGQLSVRKLTNESEQVTDEYTYSAFGEVIVESGSTENSFKYVGEAQYNYDPSTNDMFARNRTLNPQIGRWQSLDPAGFVDGENLYIYVNNDPIGLVDPSGLNNLPNRFGSPHYSPYTPSSNTRPYAPRPRNVPRNTPRNVPRWTPRTPRTRNPISKWLVRNPYLAAGCGTCTGMFVAANVEPMRVCGHLVGTPVFVECMTFIWCEAMKEISIATKIAMVACINICINAACDYAPAGLRAECRSIAMLFGNIIVVGGVGAACEELDGKYPYFKPNLPPPVIPTNVPAKLDKPTTIWV